MLISQRTCDYYLFRWNYYILLYVDDMLIKSDNEDNICALKRLMLLTYKMKDFEQVMYSLDLKFNGLTRVIMLTMKLC